MKTKIEVITNDASIDLYYSVARFKLELGPRLSGKTSAISTPRLRMFVTTGVTANSYITANGDYNRMTVSWKIGLINNLC